MLKTKSLRRQWYIRELGATDRVSHASADDQRTTDRLTDRPTDRRLLLVSIGYKLLTACKTNSLQSDRFEG